jgi:hypothetical protein
MLVGCEPDLPEAHPGQAPQTSADPARTFPGGGRILFLRSRGPGYPWGSVGLLSPDGTLRNYPRGPHAYPSWDPIAADRILMLPYGEPTVTRSLRIVGDRFRTISSWKTSEGWTFPSLDGRTIAFVPVDRSGRPLVRLLRIIDRPSGTRRTVPAHGLTPLAWMPGRRLLAGRGTTGKAVSWDPWTGSTQPFPVDVDGLSWDPAGRRFAAARSLPGDGSRADVIIGDVGGHIAERAWSGPGRAEFPTWSPDGTRIAFIVRGTEPRAHRRSTLHVYDLSLGIDTVVADPVSDSFWASWSPDGHWLLVDDWTRDRWLFVAAAGEVVVPYPWLGAFPRWCCPSSPPVSVPIPVS